MKTICVKCAYHVYGERNDLCIGPWKKVFDPVSGKSVPKYEHCKNWNDGACKYFKSMWYVRLWNFFLNDIQGVQDEP